MVVIFTRIVYGTGFLGALKDVFSVIGYELSSIEVYYGAIVISDY